MPIEQAYFQTTFQCLARAARTPVCCFATRLVILYPYAQYEALLASSAFLWRCVF